MKIIRYVLYFVLSCCFAANQGERQSTTWRQNTVHSFALVCCKTTGQHKMKHTSNNFHVVRDFSTEKKFDTWFLVLKKFDGVSKNYFLVPN